VALNGVDELLGRRVSANPGTQCQTRRGVSESLSLRCKGWKGAEARPCRNSLRGRLCLRCPFPPAVLRHPCRGRPRAVALVLRCSGVPTPTTSINLHPGSQSPGPRLTVPRTSIPALSRVGAESPAPILCCPAAPPWLRC
jgi:hypothetical protein